MSVTLSYDLGDLPGLGESTLKSITGFRKVDDQTFQDRDGTPVDVFSNFLLTNHRQIHQEFELVGTSDVGIGSLDYELGLFYFDEVGDQDAGQFAFGFFGAPGSRQFPQVDNDAHAIFGHLAFTPEVLDQRLRFEFGIRQTWEDKEVANEQFNLSATTPSYGKTRYDKKFQELTPSGRISLLVTDELTVYGAVSKGYLAGGFNGRAVFPTGTAAMAAGAPPSTALDFAYDEETVVNYEAGFKFQGFENRVRLNAAGFFMDYDDLQRTQLLQIGTTTFSGVNNAGKAEIWGTEVELEVIPLDGLVLGGTFGMALAEYEKFIDFDPTTGMLRDFASERRFANTPRYNYTLSAAYTLPSFAFGTLSARVDWYWQSRTFLQNGDNLDADQSPYGLLHARVTLADLDLPGGKHGDVDLSLWGRNLLDRAYKPFGIDFNPNSGGATGAAALPYTVQYFGERRTIGAELIWRFGAMI